MTGKIDIVNGRYVVTVGKLSIDIEDSLTTLLKNREDHIFQQTRAECDQKNKEKELKAAMYDAIREIVLESNHGPVG